jgi:hypothetical protein
MPNIPIMFCISVCASFICQKNQENNGNAKLSFCVCVSCVQLEEAVGMGPYLHKKRVEAQPIVMTADRF